MLKDAFTELSGFCQHVNATFEAALARFEAQGGTSVNADGMDVDGRQGTASYGRSAEGLGEREGEEEEEEEDEGVDGMES